MVERPKVEIKLTNEAAECGGLEPGYHTDAGFDLPIVYTPPGAQPGVEQHNNPDERPFWPWVDKLSQRWFNTGVRVNIPPGFAARIISRSSTYVRKGLIVYEGIIDAGYTGELMIFVSNPSTKPVKVNIGDRLAQLVFFSVIVPRFEEVDDFRQYTMRGENGFGSTG